MGRERAGVTFGFGLGVVMGAFEGWVSTPSFVTALVLGSVFTAVGLVYGVRSRL